MKNSTWTKLIAMGLFIGAVVTPVSDLVAVTYIVIAGMFACTGFICQSIEGREERGS